MNFTNINDPAGISALLSTLRASQAWADLQQANQTQNNATVSSESNGPNPSISLDAKAGPDSVKSTETSVANVDERSIPRNDGSGTPSVANLLSQLSSTSSSKPDPIPLTSNSCTNEPSSQISSFSSEGSKSTARTSIAPTKQVHREEKTLRDLTLHQALPIIGNLADDPSFFEALYKLREDQDALEQQLWAERKEIIEGQTEKVNIAIKKAKMVGAPGLSEREANALREGFVKQLDKFSKERVIPSWDSMLHIQQNKLEALGVPIMFKTDGALERHRQQQIIQILENIAFTQDGDKP